METEELKAGIIKSLLKIAKTGDKEKGAIVVLGGCPSYKLLRKNNINPFYILDELTLFENLCEMDGAVIIDEKGMLKDYAVMLETNKVFVNYGTRHSASISTSLQKEVIYVFLASASEKKVKIFKEGKMVMQIDAFEKDIEKKVSEISHFLEGAGVSGLVGAGAVYFGMIGVTVLSGVIVFGGGAYYLLKKLGVIKK
ncbi:MAG: diadenylate cyclase [Nanoarchaeota archaeon]